MLLVAVAALADTVGAYGLARDAVFAALPFASVAAIVSFGDFVDARARFAGLVLSCAVRSSAVHGVPPLAVSSLLAALALFALKAAFALAPHWRRLGSLSPAKP